MFSLILTFSSDLAFAVDKFWPVLRALIFTTKRRHDRQEINFIKRREFGCLYAAQGQ
jgi:hypothetical protein